jgi:hypothetical protein
MFPAQPNMVSQPSFAAAPEDGTPRVPVVHVVPTHDVHVVVVPLVEQVEVEATVVVEPPVEVEPPDEVVVEVGVLVGIAEVDGANDPEALHPARSTRNRVPERPAR